MGCDTGSGRHETEKIDRMSLPRGNVNLPRPYRHGVVAVIVRDQRFLVIRRSLRVSAPGKLCFPGGGMEPDETEPVAVERELREELALDVMPVCRVWRSRPHERLKLSWWHVQIDPQAVPRPAPAEVAEYAWMDPRSLAEQTDLLATNRHFLAAWRRREFELAGFLPPGS